MVFDLILLWIIEKIFGNKEAKTPVKTGRDSEGSENWIILDELDQSDFSLKDKMRQMKNEESTQNNDHGHDDYDCDFDM